MKKDTCFEQSLEGGACYEPCRKKTNVAERRLTVRPKTLVLPIGLEATPKSDKMGVRRSLALGSG